MARLLSVKEIMTSVHGIGYVETMFAKAGQPWQKSDHFVRPCAWVGDYVYDNEGSCWSKSYSDDSYNVYHVPTKEEVEEYDIDNESIYAGERIWDSKPTKAETKNTPWIDEKGE